MTRIIGSLDLAGVMDILIVAVFIYVGLVWFKKTRAFLVVVGIVMLGILYALARFLNLFMTTAMLQGFFAVILIAVIVIFQEEIRHFFERVALWGLGRRKRFETSPLVAALVRTCVDLSKAHIGALIVIAGKDPAERHIEGGVDIDGKPSESLLKSIFDRSSPGHDGAVIIKDGRILRFAAYLPLSKDLSKLTGLGTRHAAALGLAERCDAMCLVVSEERGIVSVAIDGDIRLLSDNARLGPILNDYLREKFPPRGKRHISNLIRHNFREKLTAIALAFALWMMFALGAGIVKRDFLVPIEYSNLDAGLTIERALPRELTVTLSGDERAFRLFNPDDLKATIDAKGAKEGRQKLTVGRGPIPHLPHNLKLDSVRPAEIDLELKKNDGQNK